MTIINLRDYQELAISGVREAFRAMYKNVLLVLATGAGKTICFSYIAKAAAEKRKNVLILAHRDALIKQASAKLRDYGVPHGIIMAKFTPDPHQRVQVGSVQTLIKRLKKVTFKPDLIVIDEAHLSAAKSYRDILQHFDTALVLGVTGSPIRLDNKPLGREYGGIYDTLVQGIAPSNLMAQGFLVRPVVYAPLERLDLSGIKKSKGDLDTAALAEVVDKPVITGSAVAHYKRICPDAPAIAWCVTIEHAIHVAEEFRAAGIPSAMLCGDHDGNERDRVGKELQSGKIKVVTFVGILVEGVDWPAIGCIILLRPTLSLSSYLQVIGRGLRPVYLPGAPLGTAKERLAAIANSRKPCCYVLDHGGLTFRHGMADEDREWSLEWGEKKKAGKAKPKDDPVDVIQCKQCFGVFAPADICPHCGAPVEVRSRKLDVVDGELQEITQDMAEAMRKQKRREVGQARTLDDLRKIEAQRGYTPGWADHVFKSRTGKK